MYEVPQEIVEFKMRHLSNQHGWINFEIQAGPGKVRLHFDPSFAFFSSLLGQMKEVWQGEKHVVIEINQEFYIKQIIMTEVKKDVYEIVVRGSNFEEMFIENGTIDEWDRGHVLYDEIDESQFYEPDKYGYREYNIDLCPMVWIHALIDKYQYVEEMFTRVQHFVRHEYDPTKNSGYHELGFKSDFYELDYSSLENLIASIERRIEENCRKAINRDS